MAELTECASMCTPTHTAHYTALESVRPVSQCLRHRLNAEGVMFSKAGFKVHDIGHAIKSINSTAYCVTLSRSLNSPLLKSLVYKVEVMDEGLV